MSQQGIFTCIRIGWWWWLIKTLLLCLLTVPRVRSRTLWLDQGTCHRDSWRWRYKEIERVIINSRVFKGLKLKRNTHFDNLGRYGKPDLHLYELVDLMASYLNVDFATFDSY